jgi:hypothetical protein
VPDFVDVQGNSRKHTICVDWDGTLVEAKWPAMGDWMPGAIKAMKALHNAGANIIVYSARLNPRDPWSGNERAPGEVFGETQRVRNKLDEAGLHFVHIYTKTGKPGASVYIDDRGVHYNGRPNAWKAITERLLTTLFDVAPEFPVFDTERFDEYQNRNEVSSR